jgi:adenylate cyclase
MLRFLPSLDQHWKPLTGDYFHLGIGIHTGTALVGNAGSRRRMKFGPRGHCVNLASRVEGVTKHLDVPIVLTGATRQQLRSSFSLRRLCRARMAGVEETVDLYELSAPGESPAWSRLRDTYEAALRHYELAEWPTALAILEQIGSDAELLTDGATDALRRRVQTLLQEPPAAFAGIWEFESK